MPYLENNGFQFLIEAIPNGVLLVDDSGTIVSSNSEVDRMFGYEKGELIGHPIELLIPHKYKKTHPADRKLFLEHPQKRSMGAGRDLSGLKKDNTEFPVEIGLNPMIHLGQPLVLALVVDITERKMIEEKLKNAYEQVQGKNEEMEQFVYTVSHDLKSPLVTCTSFFGFLKDDFENKRYEAVPDSLFRLERAHKKMQELINDLLNLSRVGRMELQLGPLDLSLTISEVLENYKDIIATKKVRIKLPPAFPLIKADRKRLFQVVDNIINNYLKYAVDVDEPSLVVMATENSESINICFKDNGPGISPEYHQFVFGLFQRLDNSKEGTGVGLTIVSRIMSLHGGKVWIHSDGRSGTEFWLSFKRSS